MNGGADLLAIMRSIHTTAAAAAAAAAVSRNVLLFTTAAVPENFEFPLSSVCRNVKPFFLSKSRNLKTRDTADRDLVCRNVEIFARSTLPRNELRDDDLLKKRSHERRN